MWTKDYGNNLFCNGRACLNGQGSHFITISVNLHSAHPAEQLHD